MSISEEITKLQNNLEAAFNSISSKGGTVPTKICFDNLSSTIQNLNPLINNVVIAGSPTVQGHKVSNFSASNYIKTNTTLRCYVNNVSATWEVQLKIMTGSVSGTQALIGGETNMISGVFLAIVNGGLRLQASSNGSKWNLVSEKTTTNTLQANQTYWVRLAHIARNNQWDFQISVSTNGTSFTEWLYTGSSTNGGPNPGALVLGQNASASPFLGSIDLSDCYIKMGSVYLWRGCYNNAKA